MTDTSREALIKELRMIGPLSHGHFSDVGNRAADMLEADGKAQDAEPCKGLNCGSLSPKLHSSECFDEHEALAGFQRPFGYFHFVFDSDNGDHWRETDDKSEMPLFAHPAPPTQQVVVPVPLTDGEIDAVTISQWGEMHGQPLAAHRAFARAIEAMLAATQGAKP